MSEFEAERLARIAENKRRMSEFGLAQASTELRRTASAPLQRKTVKRQACAPAKRLTPTDLRRSSRTEGKPAPNYNDGALDAAERAIGTKRRRTFDTLIVGAAEEKYTEAHLAMLGDCQQPWELFVDGYDAGGNRIYDKVEGQTCHQCRQKTMGRRTSCSKCHSLTGVFCGDCLYMRYGENVDEANANANWTCPHCRDPLLCNCSQHRNRRGWSPTGALYRKAVALGYKSVAHYLVLNHLEEPEQSARAGAAAAAEPASPTAAQAGKASSQDSIPAPGTPPREDAGATSTPPIEEAAATAARRAQTRRRQARIDEVMPQRRGGARSRKAAAAGPAKATKQTAIGSKRISAGAPTPEMPVANRLRSCRLAA